MDPLSAYLVLAVVILLINIAPAFVPPTWSVLAFFYLRYDLNLIFVIGIGVLMATSGRVILYLLSRYFKKYLLSYSSQKNLESLGAYLNSNRKVTLALILGYAFIPLPSNQLFIAAGFAKANLKLLAGSFAFGRVISYTWTVLLTGTVVNAVPIPAFFYAKETSILFQLAGFAGIYVLSKVNWGKLLKQSAT